jgi:hypothetical protein
MSAFIVPYKFSRLISNIHTEVQSKMDDCKHDSKNIENAFASNPLAGYSDAQKSKALRKLDWNLIPLYEFPCILILWK